QELDTSSSLPLLGTRVYLLRYPFETTEARGLLATLRRRQPKNAVLALEEARLRFRYDDDAAGGVEALREAGALPEFQRSHLTAIPETLRSSVSLQRTVRRIP